MFLDERFVSQLQNRPDIPFHYINILTQCASLHLNSLVMLYSLVLMLHVLNV